MVNHNDEKYKLEEYAVKYFLEEYNTLKKKQYAIKAHKDKPDFVAEDSEAGKVIGIEITYLFYDNEEAEMLLGQSKKKTSALMDSTKAINRLNELLEKKNKDAIEYKFDKSLILVIRVASRIFDKSDFDMHTADIRLPINCIFKEIWLLFYNFQKQSWSDLKDISEKVDNILWEDVQYIVRRMSPQMFYRKYVKPRKDLREVELPNRVDENEIRIERTMFPNDWRLYYWKGKHIQCKSELEARYLSVWLKHGLTNIEIPKDEKYLARIMPILERVEKVVYEVAEEKLAGYREDTQKDIISGLWLEVHDVEEPYTAKPKKKTKNKGRS